MKIVLATWLEDNQGNSLSKGKSKNRLLSYFFLREQKKEKFLPEYALRGVVNTKTKKEMISENINRTFIDRS